MAQSLLLKACFEVRAVR